MTDPVVMIADYVCPFCYLGRQSLEQYRRDREDPLAVEWHPYDLRSQKRNPDDTIDHSVDDGKDDAYYEQAKQNVRRLAEKYDVEMAQDLAVEVDSFPAQVASYHVQRTDPETWRAFDAALYDALWVDGRDIGDRDVLADIAADVGLDPTEVRAVVDDDAARQELREAFRDARRAGVRGVPTFVYGEHAAQGAVPPEQLRRLVEGA